jgi:hypothetical protein
VHPLQSEENTFAMDLKYIRRIALVRIEGLHQITREQSIARGTTCEPCDVMGEHGFALSLHNDCDPEVCMISCSDRCSEARWDLGASVGYDSQIAQG